MGDGGGGHGGGERGQALLAGEAAVRRAARGRGHGAEPASGAAPAAPLAPQLPELPAKGLAWHLPVLFLRFVFPSSLLQSLLCSGGPQEELTCRRDSCGLHQPCRSIGLLSPLSENLSCEL